MGVSGADINSGSLSVDQPLYRVLLVLLGEMCVPHGHLDCLMAHQFGAGAKINTCDDQPTSECMP